MANDASERFWSKVDKSGGRDSCWRFTGAIDRNGRGSFHFLGKTRMAHKVAAELLGIDVPGGMVICHLCDNPSCCNPNHFFVGTQKDNIWDMWAKGRAFAPPGTPYAGIRHDRSLVDQAIALSSEGLSQSAISRLCGMSQSNISRILSGKIRAEL